MAMNVLINAEGIAKVSANLIELIDKMSQETNTLLAAANYLEANLHEETSRLTVETSNEIIRQLNATKKMLQERFDSLLEGAKLMAKYQNDLSRRN